MNQIGEVIDTDKCKCREMNFEELLRMLGRGTAKFMSWGSHNIRIDKKKGMKLFRMNVQGHHHRGHVYVFLNGADLFDVYLTTNRGTIKKRTDEMGIYNDMLVDWIDERVERISEYVR